MDIAIVSKIDHGRADQDFKVKINGIIFEGRAFNKQLALIDDLYLWSLQLTFKDKRLVKHKDYKKIRHRILELFRENSCGIAATQNIFMAGVKM